MFEEVNYQNRYFRSKCDLFLNDYWSLTIFVIYDKIFNKGERGITWRQLNKSINSPVKLEILRNDSYTIDVGGILRATYKMK